MMNEDTAIKKINENPALLDVLYDMDLLPEQLKRPSKDWRRMLILTAAWPDSTAAATRSTG